MFGFGADARKAQHTQLLALARNALEKLNVEPLTLEDGTVTANWAPGTTIPFEFQKFVHLNVDTLLAHVHDPRLQGHLGDKDFIQEVAEALRFVQGYLAGAFPDNARAAFRVIALEDLSKDLAKEVETLTEREWALDLRRDLWTNLLRVGREVQGWFPDDVMLGTAVNAFVQIHGRQPVVPKTAVFARWIKQLEDAIARNGDTSND